jgi:hypothetical protein
MNQIKFQSIEQLPNRLFDADSTVFHEVHPALSFH